MKQIAATYVWVCCIGSLLVIVLVCIKLARNRRNEAVNVQEYEDLEQGKEMIVDSKGRLFEINTDEPHCGYETGAYPL